jgi:hypothetical protein
MYRGISPAAAPARCPGTARAGRAWLRPPLGAAPARACSWSRACGQHPAEVHHDPSWFDFRSRLDFHLTAVSCHLLHPFSESHRQRAISLRNSTFAVSRAAASRPAAVEQDGHMAAATAVRPLRDRVEMRRHLADPRPPMRATAARLRPDRPRVREPCASSPPERRSALIVIKGGP